MKLLMGDSGKKATAVLAVAFFTLYLLIVVGCGNGTGEGNGKAIKSNPQPATSGNTWTNTNGGVSSLAIQSLAYDSGHNLLYGGANGQGAWKYDSTTWTDISGGVSSFTVFTLAYDSGHNFLYAGCYDPATRTCKGVWK